MTGTLDGMFNCSCEEVIPIAVICSNSSRHRKICFHAQYASIMASMNMLYNVHYVKYKYM